MGRARWVVPHASLVGRNLPVASRREGDRSRWLTAALFTLALVATACGDDASPAVTSDSSTRSPATAITTTTAPAAFPVTVRGTVIPDEPARIVSGSATHTEVIFEIGAGGQVVATDHFSDYPASAQQTEKFDAFNLNVEAIAAFDPDLVILSYDPGDVVAGLDALEIPTILFAPPGPSTMDEVYSEWLDLGLATGHADDVVDLIDQTRAEIEALVAAMPQYVRAFTYFVELDSTLFTAGPGSLLDHVFGVMGMANVVESDAEAFSQLTAEALIARDPDFVFLTDVAYGESIESFSARPGFSALRAVANGDVIELDSDVSSRWGPRLVELFRVIAKEVHGIG